MKNFYDIKVYQETAEYLLEKLPQDLKQIKLGVICGSGLSGLVECFDSDPIEFDYKSIPNFKHSTVPGHVGKLVFGKMSGINTVCMLGRLHRYEGNEIVETVFPVRVMKLLGVSHLIVTNAAGGLNREYQVGDFMIIKDHASFAGMAGQNPLIGENLREFGDRFPPASAAYSFDLRVLAARASVSMNLTGIREGIYGYVIGPSFETRAEARFLRDGLGADCVGMSTIPEVICACHCGMKILGLSLITNKVAVGMGRSALAFVRGENVETDDESQVASHAEVLETSKNRSIVFTKFVKTIVNLLSETL
jgi:purine-nucleoside phosphorylase